MLFNIVNNSIKYSNNNTKIKIELSLSSEYVTIIVSDNGIGIDKKDLPYIFERFYRGNNSSLTDEKGAGLGLAIAKWVVEAHRGLIQVKSRKGKGSKFIIKLPRKIKK